MRLAIQAAIAHGGYFIAGVMLGTVLAHILLLVGLTEPMR